MMNQQLKHICEAYINYYESFILHSQQKNRKGILSKNEIVAFNKLNHLEELRDDKNRIQIVLNLKSKNSNKNTIKKLINEANIAMQEVVCIEHNTQILDEIFRILRLYSGTKNFTVLKIEELFEILKKELDISELPYIITLLHFKIDNKLLFKIPVNVFKESNKNKSKKLSVSNLQDWYIINNIATTLNASPNIAPIQKASINLRQLELNNKKSNVIVSKHMQNSLEFIQNQLDKKIKIKFRLKKDNITTNWIEIDKTETDNQSNSTGIYFKDGKEIIEFLKQNNDRPKFNGLEKFIISSKSKLSKTTHFIPEKYNEGKNSIKFDINTKTLLNLADNKTLYKFPLVESKTMFFNLYFDIDIDWKLFEVNKEILKLKRLQFEIIVGNKNNFAPLTETLSHIYPYDPIHEKVFISSRKESKEKNGFHVIYKNIVLKNNGLQMKLLYDTLEKYTANELLTNEKNETVRFLLQAICDEISISNTYAPALQIDISKSLIYSLSYRINFKDFKELLTSHITLHLVSNKQKLSKINNKKLIAFALLSIGDETLKEFFLKYNEVNDRAIRFKLVLKLAKRIRWEIIRKIYFFDHTATMKDMGLRLLGNTKPNDINSIYYPQIKPMDNKTIIEQHSIRTQVKKITSPANFHYNFIKKIEAQHLNVISLKGLFSKEKLLIDEQYFGIDIEFQSDKLQIPKDLILKGANNTRLTCKLSDISILKTNFIRRVYAPISIQHNGNNYIIYPPKHRKKDKVIKRQRMLFSNVPVPIANVEIRVRVFIPSPIVLGPYSNDFGGDGRGPSYDSGTSRLDMDILFNPATGVIEGKQADWGESHAFDSDYTNEVTGKPYWWLTTNASSIDNDKLDTKWGENVSVDTGTKDGNPVLEINYSGTLPLETLVPGIDGHFTLEFNRTTGDVTINADHDGFPQHTLYINGVLVYNYDPEAAGNGPFALGPPTDIKQENTRSMPPSIPANPSGQSPFEDNDYDEDYTNNGGTSWEVPFEIVQNDDGSAEISSGDSTDTLYYDDEEGTWDSESGTCIEGEETIFEEDLSGSISSSEGLDGGDDLTFTFESTTDSGEHVVQVGTADSLYP